MLGWFVKPARNALVISVVVLVVAPAANLTHVGGVGTQARHLLTAVSTTASSLYDSRIGGTFGEPLTLLVLGAGFLVLARRVKRPREASEKVAASSV